MSAKNKGDTEASTLTPPIAHSTIFRVEDPLKQNRNGAEAGILTPPLAVGTYFPPLSSEGTLVGSKDTTPELQTTEAISKRLAIAEELLNVSELQSSTHSGVFPTTPTTAKDREALANLIASNDAALPRTRTRSDILGYSHAAIVGLLDTSLSADDEDPFQSFERKVEVVRDFITRIKGPAKEQISGSVAIQTSSLIS